MRLLLVGALLASALGAEWRSDFPVDPHRLGPSGGNLYFILTPGHTLHFAQGSPLRCRCRWRECGFVSERRREAHDHAQTARSTCLIEQRSRGLRSRARLLLRIDRERGVSRAVGCPALSNCTS